MRMPVLKPDEVFHWATRFGPKYLNSVRGEIDTTRVARGAMTRTRQDAPGRGRTRQARWTA